MEAPLGIRARHSGDMFFGQQLQKLGSRHIYNLFPGDTGNLVQAGRRGERWYPLDMC